VIHTIGHGRRPIEELVACLQEAGVETLVDVRRFPSSRRNPQFNQAELSAALADANLAYAHAVELGGRRSEEPGEASFACLGQFAGYAARMRKLEWQTALDTALAEPSPCFMCAETPWQRCHRRLIAELLAARGHEVVHIVEPGVQQGHNAHPAAEIRGGVLYLCGEPVAEVSSDPIR
jgi:uncharacterized protein (DUF488 family)